MIEHMPASGSCARCRAALGLASLKREGEWYCGSACADGEGAERAPAVPETWLYARPQRFFAKRAPKELKRGGSPS